MPARLAAAQAELLQVEAHRVAAEDALQRALRLYADRDHYAALRANAHDAACDVGETAWRWEVELHRLCACLQLRQSDLLCGEEAISPTISPDFGRRLSM